MKNIDKMITMLEFLKMANIEIEDCQVKLSDWSKSSNLLQLEIESLFHGEEMDYEEQKISFRLMKGKNKVLIREERKVHTNFQEVDEENDFSAHLVEDEQKVVEFTVCQDKLTVITAVVSQCTSEDVFGDQTWPITNFQTIKDFYHPANLTGPKDCPTITKEVYKVPDGYHVIQGVEGIGEKIFSHDAVKIKK